jgi:acyl-CoA synthetase (AMP-forming)/AMP-acid ligase II
MAETVFQAFTATARAAPDNVFLCAPPAAGRAYHPDGIEVTYGQTRDEVLALREVYAAAGYGHGHRVALLLENRPEFMFHYLALNALGAGIVPVNPDYRHDEMLYQMEHSETELAVAIGSRVADLEAVARERARPLPVVAAERLPSSLPTPRAAARAGKPGLDTETACSIPPGPRVGPGPHLTTVLSERRLVPRSRRPLPHRARARAHPEPASALSHERPGGDGDLRDSYRQLPGPARTLQPEPLVERRGELAGDDHPLPRRDAAALAQAASFP